MELTAVIEALRELDGPLEVVSDSAYVVNCFRDRWHVAWRRRGWRNANRKPVANRDLWEELLALWEPRAHSIEFRWVKAHAGDEWNEIVDALAAEAADTQTSRRSRPGGRPPRQPRLENVSEGGRQLGMFEAESC